MNSVAFSFHVLPFLEQANLYCDPTRASTPHSGGILVGMADCSVRTLSPGMSHTSWWAAFTPCGGELLGPDQ